MYISQGSNLGFCEPHPSPSPHIKNKRERWDELTTYAGAGGSLGPLQSVGRRVDGPIGCWGHLSCSQLGRPLSPPLPSLCQLHWPPSRGRPERLLQAVCLGGRHGMASVSCSLFSVSRGIPQARCQKREGLRGRRLASNLLSQNPASALDHGFCHPELPWSLRR